MDVGIIFLHGSGGNGEELRSHLDTYTINGSDTFLDAARRRRWILMTPSADPQRYRGAGNQIMPIWFNRSEEWFVDGVDEVYEDINGVRNSLDKVSFIFILDSFDKCLHACRW